MKKVKRPPLPKRYERFTNDREAMRLLRLIYEQDSNPLILRVMKLLQGDMDRDEAKEVLFRQQEIDEALKMLPQLGDSVRSWLLFYREQEMQ